MTKPILLKLAGATLALAISATTVWAQADTEAPPGATPAPLVTEEAPRRGRPRPPR